MSTVSLSYAELAQRLGISVDGARMKVKRHRWPKAKGNDGAMRVTVEEAEQVRTLEAHIATLTEQLAKAESRADAEREKVADLTAQLLKITTDMMALQQAQARPWWKRLAG
jgi:uncharacterized coiled-coil protein SlyX